MKIAPIQPNKEQIEALANGASMLWFPIEVQGLTKRILNEFDELVCSNCGHIVDNDNKYICDHCEGSICYDYSPLQIEQEYYVQEHQSEIKFKVIDIQVERVQNIWKNFSELTGLKHMGHNDPDFSAKGYMEAWHEGQYPNQLYKDNPYGFLVKIERT